MVYYLKFLFEVLQCLIDCPKLSRHTTQDTRKRNHVLVEKEDLTSFLLFAGEWANREVKHDIYGKQQDEIFFCQNTEKLVFIKLLSCLLPRYIK